ncbi:BMP family ABC transporter substrate-binding protein [Streptomyces sp. NPDC055078]
MNRCHRTTGAVRTAAGASALVLALTLSGCGGTSTGAGNGADGTMVLITPDPIGTNVFLQNAKAGAETAAKATGADLQVFESRDELSRSDNIQAAVDQGAGTVITVGFEFADALKRFVPANSGTDFLSLDVCPDIAGENLSCATFREQEASFLAGVAAARMTRSKTVGVVAGADIPVQRKFTDGFVEGARHANPSVKVVGPLWVAGQTPFSDPARTKELALSAASQGADVLLSATSGGDSGSFEAAGAKDLQVFGVDINHCPRSPGHVADNIIKRLDVTIPAAVAAIDKGGSRKDYGLSDGALALGSLTDSAPLSKDCTLSGNKAALDAAEKARKGIIDGTIKIKAGSR